MATPLGAPSLLLTLALAAGAPLQEPERADKPPSGRDQRALLEALFALDPVSVEDQAAVRARLAPYGELPAPTGTKRKKLLAAIEKAWRAQDPLPKKAGEYWYWDEPQKGRYFVAGKVKKPKGLFIGLHGGGVGSADASGAHGAFKAAAAKRDWVAIFPQAIEATERGWVDAGTEEWIVGLIDQARRTYGVPADRIYIGGHSMGGFGSWTLGAHHADLFAAAVPSAGAPSPIYNRDGTIYGMETGVIPNLRNLPMCVFQSTDDPRVPPDVNQAAVRDVRRARTRWDGYEDFEILGGLRPWPWLPQGGHGRPVGPDRWLRVANPTPRRSPGSPRSRGRPASTGSTGPHHAWTPWSSPRWTPRPTPSPSPPMDSVSKDSRSSSPGASGPRRGGLDHRGRRGGVQGDPDHLVGGLRGVRPQLRSRPTLRGAGDLAALSRTPAGDPEAPARPQAGPVREQASQEARVRRGTGIRCPRRPRCPQAGDRRRPT